MITGVMRVTQCAHVTVKTFAWIENLPGKPPAFVFEGFPSAGVAVLSKNELIVLCKECRDHVPEAMGMLIKEVPILTPLEKSVRN